MFVTAFSHLDARASEIKKLFKVIKYSKYIYTNILKPIVQDHYNFPTMEYLIEKKPVV